MSLRTWRGWLLRADDQLLERVQWLFVLLNCVLAVTSPLDMTVPGAPPWPMAGVIVAASLAFGAWSIVYFRRGGGSHTLDVVPLALLFVGGAAGGGLDWMFGRMYVAVFLAALYRPSRGRLTFLSVVYLATYEIAAIVGGEQVVVANVVSEGVSLVVVIAIMQTLATVVKRHELFAHRDALLTQVVGGLLAQRNTAQINQTAADVAYRLVNVSGALVTIWQADGERLRRTALAGREDHPFVEADLSVLPQGYRDIYAAARPAFLDADQLNDIHRHYGLTEQFVAAVVAPIVADGHPTGLLVVGSPETLDDDLLRVFERFAHEVALALELAERETMLTGLVENSSDVIAVVDDGHTFTYVSPAIAATAGIGADAVQGEPLGSLLRHPDSGEALSSVAHLPARVPTALRLVHSGVERDVEVTANPLSDGTTILNIRDVSERRRLEAEIEYRAFHDVITGLPNRQLFLDRLDGALRRQQRHGGLFAVVIVDIDDFKSVNDNLGHAAGDALLIEVARRLTEVLRATDTAARLGGDEFALLLEGFDAEAQATMVVDRVLDALRRPFQVEGRQLAVSASLGLAITADAVHPDELIRNADVAMYSAKRAGKNRCTVFESSMSAGGAHHLQAREEFEEAIRARQFELRYQPIIVLDSGQVSGFEALVRWNHPSRGLLLPGEFIPLAEETGLVVDLGQWIIREACEQLSRWQARSDHPINLSVNLSAVQLRNVDIVDDVALAITAAGIAAEQLTLEVTETALLGDTAAVAAVLRDLKNLGVRLAIDDFGTGYSSFAHLQVLPVDVIKVDRAFVSVIQDGPEQAALAKAMVNIAQTLGLDTVAEGVENPEQSGLLRSWGCASAQGWLWHPAVSAEDAGTLLERNHAPAPVR